MRTEPCVVPASCRTRSVRTVRKQQRPRARPRREAAGGSPAETGARQLPEGVRRRHRRHVKRTCLPTLRDPLQLKHRAMLPEEGRGRPCLPFRTVREARGRPSQARGESVTHSAALLSTTHRASYRARPSRVRFVHVLWKRRPLRGSHRPFPTIRQRTVHLGSNMNQRVLQFPVHRTTALEVIKIKY